MHLLFCFRVGRKLVILSTGPTCFLGWVIALVWKTLPGLYVMRILQGIALGVACTLPPIYTAEIAEPKLRGRLSGNFLTFLYLGTLYSFSIGPYLTYDNYIIVSLPLPVISTLLFLYCPETPYFLLMKGREKEAKEVLQRLRDSTDIEEELATMKNSVEEEMSEKNSWRTLFCDKAERKAFVIVQIVCIAKFMTGIPMFLNYAVETFTKSETFLPPAEMSILLAVLLSGIAVVSAFLSDWIGRKPLLLVSCFGCFVAHAFSGLYYFLHEKTSVDAAPYTWTLYLGLVMYCFFFDIGLGPLLQTLQSELFGASTRGLAGGITEAFAALLCFIVIKAYSPINKEFGVYFNFWLYSIVALLCGIFVFCLMYETAGKRIGQIERQISKNA